MGTSVTMARSDPRLEAHQVVASSSGKRVLLGAHEDYFLIHDLVRNTQSKVIQATFDFGGRRLAVSDALNGVVTAAYGRDGLAFLKGSTGQEGWRRKDIKKIGRITLSRDGRTAFCSVEEASLVAVDLRTGTVRYKVRGADSVHESPYEKVTFIDGRRPQVVDRHGDR